MNQPRLDEHRRVRRLRTWVLFDRDAGRKDQRQPSQEVTAATTACKQHVADDPWPLCWCRLRRRHIECYLPDKVLLDWARDKSAAVQAGVNALIRLRASDPEAAYSLHMKGGLCKDLPKDQRKQLSADSQSADQRTRSAAEQGVSSWTPPWDSVPAQHRADLLAGFGLVGRLFEDSDAAFDPQFPAEFDRYEHLKASELVGSILERL